MAKKDIVNVDGKFYLLPEDEDLQSFKLMSQKDKDAAEVIKSDTGYVPVKSPDDGSRNLARNIQPVNDRSEALKDINASSFVGAVRALADRQAQAAQTAQEQQLTNPSSNPGSSPSSSSNNSTGNQNPASIPRMPLPSVSSSSSKSKSAVGGRSSKGATPSRGNIARTAMLRNNKPIELSQEQKDELNEYTANAPNNIRRNVNKITLGRAITPQQMRMLDRTGWLPLSIAELALNNPELQNQEQPNQQQQELQKQFQEQQERLRPLPELNKDDKNPELEKEHDHIPSPFDINKGPSHN